MKTQIKIFILSLAFTGVLSSCVNDADDFNQRPTYSGYVALDYTSEIINFYSSSLSIIQMFNIYYSQPTEAKRDSVDRLYFMNTKILREDDGSSWTLHNIGYGIYGDISITTNGKTLNDDGTKWEVTIPNPYRYELGVAIFEVEKIGDGRWSVKKHDNRNYDFEYSSEWEMRSANIEDGFTIEGNGSMLSFETPKLKLDFTITEPLKITFDGYYTFISTGTINILATDVDKNITEETTAEVLSDYTVRISHKNKIEDWNYSIFQWWR